MIWECRRAAASGRRALFAAWPGAPFPAGTPGKTSPLHPRADTIRSSAAGPNRQTDPPGMAPSPSGRGGHHDDRALLPRHEKHIHVMRHARCAAPGARTGHCPRARQSVSRHGSLVPPWRPAGPTSPPRPRCLIQARCRTASPPPRAIGDVVAFGYDEAGAGLHLACALPSNRASDDPARCEGRDALFHPPRLNAEAVQDFHRG